MPPFLRPPVRWPQRLLEAIAELRRAPATHREGARAEVWRLVHAALFASLRAQAGRITAVAAEDIEDMASQKALELLLRSEEGAWDPSGRAEHEVAGYVARVARHALVDLARQRGREAPPMEDEESWAVALSDHLGEVAGPFDQAVAHEFAIALRTCVEALAPRARHAWFRRVFLERPSREIAAALGLSPAHVDVLVQRARTSLRACMEKKGHRDAEMRPGAFVELWSHLTCVPLAGLEHQGEGTADGHD